MKRTLLILSLVVASAPGFGCGGSGGAPRDGAVEAAVDWGAIEGPKTTKYTDTRPTDRGAPDAWPGAEAGVAKDSRPIDSRPAVDGKPPG